ncbi:hypothetical protein [Thalassotalea agariperforans]
MLTIFSQFNMNSIINTFNQANLQQGYIDHIQKSGNEIIQPATSDNSTTPYSNTKNASIIVNLSNEAQKKLAEEQSAIANELAKQTQLKKTQQTEEVSETDTERFDKMIEKVQEKIKEVQQQIRALNGEKTEDAQAKRKALDSQLVSLNATLIGLLGKKIEALEA